MRSHAGVRWSVCLTAVWMVVMLVAPSRSQEVLPSSALLQQCVFDRECGDGLRGHTQNVGTGPDRGSSGQTSDQYMYLDSNVNTTASVMSTPTLLLPLGGTVAFFYHMLGLAVGTLRLEVTVSGQAPATIWERAREQHSAHATPWTLAAVGLPANTTKVTWVGTHFLVGGHSDIALDNITITAAVEGITFAPSVQPTATPTAGGRAFACDFSSPVEGPADTLYVCGMNLTNRWFTNTGPTGSSDTGPLFGYTRLAEDRYVYLETSENRGSSGESNITTPQFALPFNGHVVFFYHVRTPPPPHTHTQTTLVSLPVVPRFSISSTRSHIADSPSTNLSA
jgi:hypothetical protein